MARRLLTLWLFPVCLLLAQVGAVTHGLGHASGNEPTKERIGTADACVQCASFAKLGHLATATLDVAIAESLDVPVETIAPYGFRFILTAAFEPRAPPRIL